MTGLLYEIDDQSRRCLAVIAEGFAADYEWPIWQYVDLTLAREGIDAQAVWQQLPTWQYHYRPVWVDGNAGGALLPESPVALTVTGMHYVRDDLRMRDLSDAFLAVLREAAASYDRRTPSTRSVQQVEIPDSSVALLVLREKGVVVDTDRVKSLLRHEPATWNGITDTATGWSWDATRLPLGRYRGIETTEDYLGRLEALVGTPSFRPAVDALPPNALLDALDHLNLAWRVVVKEPLLSVGRLEGVGRLTQPVGSGADFASAMSALADIVTSFTTRTRDAPSIVGMKARLQNVLGAEQSGIAEAAADVLRAVVVVRVDLQHQGAEAKSLPAWEALGLNRFGDDWNAMWEKARQEVVDALRSLREELLASETT